MLTNRISGTYFCMNMTLITLSSFLAAIVINTYIRGDRTNVVPPWLKRVNILLRYIVSVSFHAQKEVTAVLGSCFLKLG